ncbi:SLBB domain-containing protein [Methylolobus aquaticus]
MLFVPLMLAGCGAWEVVPDGQPGAIEAFEVPKRSTKVSPDAAVNAFKAETDQASDYRLGDGDDVFLEVVGRPELSGAHRIGPDGRITLSVAGPIMVRNLTRQEAADAITRAMLPYYRNVYSTVRVDKYNSNRVIVIGRVESPGALAFETPPHLLEVLAKAGGLPLIRKEQVLTRCAVIRGEKILWVDLKRLLTGDTALNIRLQRDDVVYIPDSTDTSVFVLGEVKQPGVYRLTPQMSLMDALSQAGGPSREANMDDIHVIRPNKGVNLALSMEELLSADPKLNVAIEEGDILYVPRSGVAKVGYIVQQMNPFGYLFLIKAFAFP